MKIASIINWIYDNRSRLFTFLIRCHAKRDKSNRMDMFFDEVLGGFNSYHGCLTARNTLTASYIRKYCNITDLEKKTAAMRGGQKVREGGGLITRTQKCLGFTFAWFSYNGTNYM